MDNKYFLDLLQSAELRSISIEIMCNDINKNQDTIDNYMPRLRDILNEINKNINKLCISDKEMYEISKNKLWEIHARFDDHIIRDKILAGGTYTDIVIINFLEQCQECLKTLNNHFFSSFRC